MKKNAVWSKLFYCIFRRSSLAFSRGSNSTGFSNRLILRKVPVTDILCLLTNVQNNSIRLSWPQKVHQTSVWTRGGCEPMDNNASPTSRGKACPVYKSLKMAWLIFWKRMLQNSQLPPERAKMRYGKGTGNDLFTGQTLNFLFVVCKHSNTSRRFSISTGF